MNEYNNKQIPVNDLKLSQYELDCALDALNTGFISGTTGKYLQLFENSFASFTGSKYSIACSSGTTALQLALRVLNLNRGDEVIVNTFTNIASVLAIIYNGAKPVLVDSRHDTWSMDEEKIEEKITDKTKVIMPVHIYGHPVKMDTVIKLAKKYKLKVVEDAAEAHGAKFENNVVGHFGDMGCFSFLAGKIITTGEGGAVVTNNRYLANRLKSLRGLAFGKGENRYMHRELGFNFRMSNLSAAIGYGQMSRADELITFRRKLASWYNEELEGVKGLTLPIEKPWAKNVYWVYGIVVNEDFRLTRSELMRELAQRYIESRPFFVPMHKQRVFKSMGLFRNEKYPVSEYLGSHGMYLPSGSTLTREDIHRIGKSIREIAR